MSKECKYCGEPMAAIDEWVVPNPHSPIAPARAQYFACSPECDAGFDTETEQWTAPDPYACEEDSSV